MQTLTIRRHEGHPLLPIGDRIALVDTGSSVSVAEAPFDFAGEPCEPVRSLAGWSTAAMSDLSGFRMDILLGCDVLARHTIRLRWADGALDVGDDIPAGPVATPLSRPGGSPGFPARLQGAAIKALLDTGAHLSYVHPDLVAGRRPSGQRPDFHPLAGRYIATTYTLAVGVADDAPVELEFGVPPHPNLRAMMEMVRVVSGVSAVIGTQFLEFYDCTLAWDRGVISWTRRAPRPTPRAPDGDGR